MTIALIGHTGFVGQTLLGQAAFEVLYRSTNIEEIAGRRHELVVCAGAPAAKWKANQDPAADWAGLQRLISSLDRMAGCGRFVLVSTVDVYPDPSAFDEDAVLEPGEGGAYGRHRLALERFCQDRFDATVVRLPALFGRGLRKNAIFDLLNDNGVEKLNPLSTFQFYDMACLWTDLQRVLGAELHTVNLATEPIQLGEVARRVFGRTLLEQPGSRPQHYDLRTRHSGLWGRSGGYAYGADEVWRRLQAFVDSERAGGVT